MNTTLRLLKKSSCKKYERHISVHESLEKSLKELKLIKQGKLKAKTWDELYKDLKNREK